MATDEIGARPDEVMILSVLYLLFGFSNSTFV